MENYPLLMQNNTGMHPELQPPGQPCTLSRRVLVLSYRTHPVNRQASKRCSFLLYAPFFPALLIGASLDQTYDGVCGHRPRSSGDRVAESGYVKELALTKKRKT